MTNSLSEDFMLLILDNKSKQFTIRNDLFIELALSGSLLLELILKGRLSFLKDKLIVVDETPLKNQLLNQAFDLIKIEDDHYTSLYWLRELNDNISDIKKKVINSLENNDLIRVQQSRLFFFIPITKFEIQDPQIQNNIRSLIQKSISETKEIEPRTIALISLLYATNSARQIFSTDELENYITVLRGIVGGENIGKSISESIQIITDALMRNYIVNFYNY